MLVAMMCAGLLTGCGSGPGAGDVSAAAARFLDAAARGDGGSACELLVPKVRADVETSEGQPCAQSLPVDRLRGTVRGAEVWSDWAVVDTDSGALYLTEFDSGWLVTAAGCRPAGDQPDQCVVGA
jgi:hypothetical protein